mmetsp:Transcript_94155/g.269894  ORF Transcript_94155/g.269894 Transcript_94155/m.269894 type:complete len:172 (+) Transcript_94155:116-631(+)
MGAATSGVACCGKRDGIAWCQNDRLNVYLENLAQQSKTFDSAWLYREELLLPISPRACAPSPQYILLYQRSETKDGAAGGASGQALAPERVRTQLRLDWSRDGLCFMETDRRLPEELLVRSKVLDPPLSPSALLSELAEVKGLIFDAEAWSSQQFCFKLMEMGTGREYDYR